MQDFAAIDFETANNDRSSVCSVGVVIVRDGEIVDSFYSLIQPEPNYYNYWCSQVHGLCCDDTDDAPLFPEVWAQIEPLIEGLPLVAHNRPFDESCLKAVFRVYQMDYPDYEFYSACIRWIILTMSSTTRFVFQGEFSLICRIISCILWQRSAAIFWRTTITPLPTQKLVLG